MENSSPAQPMRLARYLAMAGVASRRNCEQLIIDGRVTVNGVAVTTPAHNIHPGVDKICFEGRELDALSRQRIYILLNKPAGYTCAAKDAHAKELVFELIPQKFGRLFTIGRLDRDSEGLLILTNDGDYAQRLIHPSMRVTKRYYVECTGHYSTSIRRQLLDGMYDNDEFLRALAVEQKSFQRGSCALEITLGDGRKREVRRMCKDVGLQVQRLRRVAVGCLTLDESLPVGSWRLMTEDELQLAITPEKIAEPAANAPVPKEPVPYWQLKKRQQIEEAEKHAPKHPRREKRDGEERGEAFSRPSGAASTRRDRSRDDRPAEDSRKRRSTRRGDDDEAAPKEKRPWYERVDREFEGYKVDKPRVRAKAPWMQQGGESAAAKKSKSGQSLRSRRSAAAGRRGSRG